MDVGPAGSSGAKPSAQTNPLITFGALAFIIACAAVAYYFAVSLPAYNAARLALERERYADEGKRHADEAKKAEEKEQQRGEALSMCLSAAEQRRFTFLKLNGTTESDGRIKTPESVNRVADERKKSEVDACFKQFGR